MEIPEEKYGERLKICEGADITELEDNIRCAMSILDSFPDIYITVRKHVLEYGVKNPEYIINGLIADRKGIMSEKGISAAFNKGIKQGCKAIVLDLDDSMARKPLNPTQIAKYISFRLDFSESAIRECYIVYKNKALRISYIDNNRERLTSIIEKFKADISQP